MDDPAGKPGRYRLDRELGRRAGAVTWLATDLETGARCRVKELSLRAAGFAEAQADFEEHARILSRLRHPGLPAFNGFSCREEGSDVRCRLVQEYVEGESLDRVVEGGRRLTGAPLLDLLRQGAGVLEYLHRQTPPLVHRDLRPANLILGADGRLRLTDFDFRSGRRPDPPAAALLPWLASGFAPPEALTGAWTPASDVFSLGMTAVYAITGVEPPFLGEGKRFDLRKEARVPGRLARVLERMTDPDPARRYRDGAALAEALRRIGRRARPRKKSGRLAIAGAALLLAGVAFALLREEGRAPAARQMPPAARPAPAPPRAAPRVMTPEAVPAAAGGVVEGRLFFDGRPVQEVTPLPPTFWFRNEARNVVEKPEVRYAGGAFRIAGLPAGAVGMSVRIDLNRENIAVYPGDLDAWTHLDVPGAGTLPVEIPLRKVIRLREPVDNDALLVRGKVPCGGGYVLRSPVRFRWDPVADGVEYDVRVDRMDCGRNYNTAGNTFVAKTGATEVDVDLPPSLEGECYGFRLFARRGQLPVGMFTTHGESYLAWDFRFTVRE